MGLSTAIGRCVQGWGLSLCACHPCVFQGTELVLLAYAVPKPLDSTDRVGSTGVSGVEWSLGRWSLTRMLTVTFLKQKLPALASGRGAASTG